MVEIIYLFGFFGWSVFANVSVRTQQHWRCLSKPFFYILTQSCSAVLPLGSVDVSEKFLKCCTTITTWIFYSQTAWRALHNSPGGSDSWEQTPQKLCAVLFYTSLPVISIKSEHFLLKVIQRTEMIILQRAEQVDANSIWSDRFWSASHSAVQ